MGVALAPHRRSRNMAQTRTAKVRGGAKATIDHDEIRRWVEAHGGKPAVVKRTARGSQAGILRVDFPGYSGEKSLEPLSWDDWFARFERANLAFLYQDETGSGRPSRFNKLVGRETVEVSPPGRATRAIKRSVPRRWAKKGARTRAELEQVESRGQRPSRGRAAGGGAGRAGAGARTTARKPSSARATGAATSRRAAGQASSRKPRKAASTRTRGRATGSTGRTAGSSSRSTSATRSERATMRGSSTGRSRARGA